MRARLAIAGLTAAALAAPAVTTARAAIAPPEDSSPRASRAAAAPAPPRVPEPASPALMGSGALALVLVASRRRAQSLAAG